MHRRSAPALLLLLGYLAFVSLGLPDALLGVAWPSLRDTFGLSQALLGLPLAINAVAYFFSGLLAGRLMQLLGIGLLLAASTALVAAGVFGFSAAQAFGLFLLATPIVGFGSGAIDAALNSYAAKNFSPKHMSWLHAAYAAGATLGPAVMTVVLASGESWRLGYAVIGGVLAVLAVAFTAARHRWLPGKPGAVVVVDAPGGEPPVPLEERPATAGAAIRSRRVWLQLAIFFVYTGTEVAAGQWSYTILTEDRGLSPSVAGSLVAAYWGGLLAGRVVLGFVVERIGQVRLLRFATVGAFLSAAIFAIPGHAWGAAALPLLSFSLASIYPGLMAETPRRVGETLAPHAVGFQVSAATAGIAVLPSVAGLSAESLGLASVGPIIAACALALLLLHERLIAVADR